MIEARLAVDDPERLHAAVVDVEALVQDAAAAAGLGRCEVFERLDNNDDGYLARREILNSGRT